MTPKCAEIVDVYLRNPRLHFITHCVLIAVRYLFIVFLAKKLKDWAFSNYFNKNCHVESRLVPHTGQKDVSFLVNFDNQILSLSQSKFQLCSDNFPVCYCLRKRLDNRASLGFSKNVGNFKTFSTVSILSIFFCFE